MFHLQMCNIKTDQLLGFGSIAKVYPYQENEEDDKWVVKEIRCSTARQLNLSLQEIVLGFNQNHSHINPITGFNIKWIGKELVVYTKMPRMKRSLADLIAYHKQTKTYLTEDNIMQYFSAVVSALRHLQSQNICHRDIKPNNILLDDKNGIKLSDIGAAKYIPPQCPEDLDTSDSIIGTPGYMAPEIFNDSFSVPKKKKNWVKADIWSLGITMIELCLLNPRRIVFETSEEEIIDLICENLSNVTSIYGTNLSELLSNLLRFDPEKRIDYKDITDALQKLEAKFESEREGDLRTIKNESSFSSANLKSQTVLDLIGIMDPNEQDDNMGNPFENKQELNLSFIKILPDEKILNLANEDYQSNSSSVSSEVGRCRLASSSTANTQVRLETKQNKNENGIRRVQHFIEEETLKTYNNIFGSLDDYLSFFENRTPEMAIFAETCKKAEIDQDLETLNKKIAPTIIDCIQREGSKHDKKNGQINLTRLFEKIFSSFKEFYGTILKAYTMETFLYIKMNVYLRNEDWIQLDDLLPYVFCLCKTFQYSNLNSICHKSSQNSLDSQDNTTPTGNLILYRGARFDEASLNYYNPEKVSFFSWNAVTSTCTNFAVAECFCMYMTETNKIPTIFMIEIPVQPVESLKNLNIINLKTFSEMPDEEEVLLPPGSIFEIISLNRDHQRALVKLRLISDANMFSLQRKIRLEPMRAKIPSGKAARVICQEGRELIEALQYLKGNRMIEEIEFRLCKYNSDSLNILAEVLLTLPRLNKISLFSSSSDQNTHLRTILNTIKKSRISSLEIFDNLLSDQEHLDLFIQGIRQLPLSSLKVDFNHAQDIKDIGLKTLGTFGIMNMTSLTNLSLNFNKCSKVTNRGLKSLCSQELGYLTSLKTLSLYFRECPRITDKGLKSLSSEGLRYLASLTTLTLDFGGCSKITNDGVKSLSLEGLRYLTLLKTLTLDFKECSKITDEGLRRLFSEGLKYLTSLKTLTLSFKGCEQISDEGVRSICSEHLRSLISLKYLTLDFVECDKITNERMNYIKSQPHILAPSLIFCSKASILSHKIFNLKRNLISNSIQQDNSTGSASPYSELTLVLDSKSKDLYFSTNSGKKKKLQLIKFLRISHKLPANEVSSEEIKKVYLKQIRHLTSITNLILDFEDCENITDEEVKSLCSEGLRYLHSLTSLTLDFEGCYKITDKALISLCAWGLKPLASLKTLTLNFKKCRQITDEGLKWLCQDGLIYLASLTNLTLNFEGCHEITGEGLNWLEGLRSLTSLITLTLGFGGCSKITNDGVKSLSSEGLRYLTSLTILTLGFRECSRITDEGLRRLCTDGLRYLTSLTSLTLDFEDCENITDEEVEILGSEGLRYLTSLTTLTLNFEGCYEITDEGMKNLCSDGLRYLTSLATLTLDFRECSRIADEGLKSLSLYGLRYLFSLTTLTLDFERCYEITDEGVKSLCSEGLRYLTSLAILTLDFKDCENITDEGLRITNLYGLRYLTSLTTLNLDFSNCYGISEACAIEFKIILNYFGFHS